MTPARRPRCGFATTAAAVGLALLMAACSGTAPKVTATGPYPGGGRYHAGRPSYQIAPYQVNGVWYYPKVDYDYDETGTASWYGPQFDQRLTSDGEVFDMNQLSAAHKTLPLPSVVEVTNLENGRALELRVNDRGPFVGDRLIDLSRRAAQLLGFEGKGTAQVRVQVLKEPSIAVAEAAQRGEFGPVVAGAAPAAQVAQAAPRPAPRVAPAPVRLAAAAPPPPDPTVAVQTSAAPVDAAPLSPAPAAAAAEPAPAAAAPPIEPAPARLAAAPPPPLEPTPVRLAAAPLPPPSHPSETMGARIKAAFFPPAAAAPLEHPMAKPIPPASKASGRIFVQAGAFSVRDNAERVQSRIAGLGNVQLMPASVNGTEVFRVRLGPLSSIEEADHLLARVVGSGFSGARIVVD